MHSRVAEDGTKSTHARAVALEQMSPARLLFALLKRRFTGTVGFDQGSARRHVWLRGGMPVYTDWDSPADVLGEVLIGTGLVSPQMCEHGLSVKAQRGGYLGRILLELGAIDEAMLVTTLTEQCARKVALVFGLQSGTAWVDPEGAPCDEVTDTLCPVNVLGLIRNGVAKHYNVARIQSEMGAALTGSVVVSDAYLRYREHFGFRRRERVLLPALERGTTLSDLYEHAASPELAMGLVYTLWVCQMLRTDAGARLANARPEGFPPMAQTDSGARPRPAASSSSSTSSAAQSSTTSGAGAGSVPRRPAASAFVSGDQRHQPFAARQDGGSSGSRALPNRGEDSHSGRLPRGDDPFENQLLTLESKLRAGAHAFALMGVSLDAGRKEVRSAWAVLSRRFHPDALEAEGRGHLRDRVQNVFAALSEANSTLSNNAERDKLKRALELDPQAGADVDPNAVVRNALEAEMLARDADKFLKAGNYPRALEIYERSLALAPREAEVQACAAWCRFQLTQRTRLDATTAMRTIAAAVDEQPRCGRAHYYLGLTRLSAGQDKLALASFEAAFEADPKLIDAERQARAIRLNSKNRSKTSEPKKSFGLRGLFGRK